VGHGSAKRTDDGAGSNIGPGKPVGKRCLQEPIQMKEKKEVCIPPRGMCK